MERLTPQENLIVAASANPVANPVAKSCEQNGFALSHSSHNLDLNARPLLCKFLTSLNAVEVSSDSQTYHTFIIQPEAYTKTLESLRESDSEVWNYVSHKLRHDLINDQFLIVKISGRLHKYTIGAITRLIESQLTTIANTADENTKQLIQDIGVVLSADVEFYGSKTFRQPDQQFLIKGLYYPGVIIEIAHSQCFEELRKKAFDFIVKSKGRVQLVIGLEIGNKRSKKSCKISSWRPEFYRLGNKGAVGMKVITDQDIIRDSDGTIKLGCLKFHLEDFGENLAAKYPDASLTKEITLDYDVLAEILTNAEQYVMPVSPGPDIIESTYPFPHSEELTPEDEKKICHLERISATRSETADPDYS